MALDMANSDASSAKVRVLAILLALAPEPRRSFHKDKFNVPLSGDLFNMSLG